MTRPFTHQKERAFTLIELIIVIVVLGILSTIALVGYKSVIDRSDKARVKEQTRSWVRQAQALYALNSPTDPAYTWEQALVAIAQDFPAYSQVGSSATTNPGTGTNGWIVETDAGSSTYSTGPNHMVIKHVGDLLYFAVAYANNGTASVTNGVFGAVPNRGSIAVWDAVCGYQSCDAQAAVDGPPTSGSYAIVVGTTTVATTTTTTSPFILSYASTTFSRASSSETKSPSVSGGPAASFAYVGTLPPNVSFNTSTGVFTGPSAWNFQVAQISAGLYHTCATTTSGSAKCWGHNVFGQLGDGTTNPQQRLTPVDVAGLTSGVTQIAAGLQHTCAVVNGGAKCWGYNWYGQIGDGTTTQRLTPVAVLGLTSGVTQIAASDAYTCAVTTSGGTKCWGANFYGNLGDGTTTHRLTPVDVAGLTSGVAQISTNEQHACAVTTSGGAKCWGLNNNGRIGDGTTTQRLTPVDVSGLTSGVTQISAGTVHTCAVTTSGGAKCWGENVYGQSGDGTTTQRRTPVDVSGLTSGVTQMSAGTYHTCAMTTSGGAKCWGYNPDGRIGDGTTTQRLTPVDVSGLTSGVTQLWAGRDYACAITTTGGAKCWGNNGNGQLGDGTTTERLTPVAVTGSGNPGWPTSITVTATAGTQSSNSTITLTTTAN